MTPLAEPYADRLHRWLSYTLSLPTLIATGAAPIWTADEEDADLTARLEELDNALALDELIFDPQRRYECGPEPQALRQLRRHEGKPPAAPAILCPDSTQTLSRIAALAAAKGFTLYLPGAAAPLDNANVLPVDFSRMNRVEIVSAASGLVRIERGASWEAVRSVVEAAGLCVPGGMETICAGPTEAAEAGLFAARPVTKAEGIVCSWEMVLPARGARIIDGVWLFRDEAKAREGLRDLCRSIAPTHAALYSDATLRLGERAGLWRLPDRPWSENRYTALRMAFLGHGSGVEGLAVEAQRFFATFPVESAGGKFWLRHPPFDSRLARSLLAERGLSEVTLTRAADFDSLATVSGSLRDRLRQAAVTHSPVPGATPLAHEEITVLAGRPMVTASVIAPRDFDDPLGQWRRIEAGASAGAPDASQPQGDAGPVSEALASQDTEAESFKDEQDRENWAGIRAALMPHADKAGGGKDETRPPLAVPRS